MSASRAQKNFHCNHISNKPNMRKPIKRPKATPLFNTVSPFRKLINNTENNLVIKNESKLTCRISPWESGMSHILYLFPDNNYTSPAGIVAQINKTLFFTSYIIHQMHRPEIIFKHEYIFIDQFLHITVYLQLIVLNKV